MSVTLLCIENENDEDDVFSVLFRMGLVCRRTPVGTNPDWPADY